MYLYIFIYILIYIFIYLIYSLFKEQPSYTNMFVQLSIVSFALVLLFILGFGRFLRLQLAALRRLDGGHAHGGE